MPEDKPPFTYVVQAHSHPETVLRLARAILADVPRSRILVHYSALSGPFPDAGDERIFVVENPVAVRWGTFSILEMMLHTLAEIRRLELPDAWIVMLSGQCYPLRPLDELERLLCECDADAYIYNKRIGARDGTVRDRYKFRYRTIRYGPLPFPLNVRAFRGVLNRVQPFFRVRSMSRISFLGVRAKRSIFDLFRDVYFCSNWFALSGKAATAVARAVAERPELLEVYRETIMPEESFFPTVIHNTTDLRTVNDDLHYIDWSTMLTGSPRSLTLDDLPAIERSGRWFARKLDPQESGLRDALDALRARNRAPQATG